MTPDSLIYTKIKMDSKNISPEAQRKLLRYPAYMTLKAANIDGKFDSIERISATVYAHLKTYSSNPLLSDFYNEANRQFETILTQLDRSLPAKGKHRAAAINARLSEMEGPFLQLEPDYVQAMHKRMKAFKDHIANVQHNAWVDFLFPMNSHGITDHLA